MSVPRRGPPRASALDFDPRAVAWARLAFVVFLFVYGAASLRHPERFRLLDSVDLAIHETGHLVFAPFGEFLGFLGGTLMQLLVPAAFLVSFARRGQSFAASVMLWWIAQNLGNVSVYVRDARSRVLPLVGGGEHDWTYLLIRLGLLERDAMLADGARLLGVVVWVSAIALGAWHARPRQGGEGEGEAAGVGLAGVSRAEGAEGAEGAAGRTPGPAVASRAAGPGVPGGAEEV